MQRKEAAMTIYAAILSAAELHFAEQGAPRGDKLTIIIRSPKSEPNLKSSYEFPSTGKNENERRGKEKPTKPVPADD